MPVCLHPAYEAVLPRTATIVDTIIAPVTGFSSGITRAEQTAFESELDSDGVFTFHHFDLSMGETRFAGWIAYDVVFNLNQSATQCFGLPNIAQYAVAVALVARGDWTFDRPSPMGPGWTCEATNFSPTGGIETSPDAAVIQADVEVAAKRFATLSIEEQRAWFVENFAALRAGELTLDDLP